MNVRRRFVKEKFIWRFILKTRRCVINKISSRQNAFAPTIKRKMGMEIETSSHIEKMTMFTFSDTILL